MNISRPFSSEMAERAPIPRAAIATLGSRASRWARRITAGRPHLLVVVATMAICSIAWALSYLLRFDFSVPAHLSDSVAATLPFVLLVQGVFFHAAGVFRILWPYVGIRDALSILLAVALSTATLWVLNATCLPAGIVPRSVLLLNGILTHAGVCGFYLMLRSLRESRLRGEPGQAPPARILIVGAGDSGDSLLREIERTSPLSLQVSGFIDDDPDKQGGRLRGVPVLGPVARIQRIARKHSVRLVLIALPSAGGARLREIVSPLLLAGLTVRVLPLLGRLAPNAPLLPQLKDVAIEDLLRREPIRLEEEKIAAFLRGKRVLVTGAAGSIGSELCRQVLKYRPERLVALDLAETPLHDLMLEIRRGANMDVVYPELGDVTDAVRVRGVFLEHAPEVVFHAAALKHVPVCEDHPREAIRVNVGGTKIVAEQAMHCAAARFILISTDKAVNPSSLMGATKRMAELVVQALNSKDGPSRFSAVRFGNVLGSNGSVLNIFRTQLAQGGPLTVTHPEMRRYFMTIPEAVELVLQAAVQGRGGEVFELDMGSPVKIVDLAEDFIRLSGLMPGRDVKIEFTGVRPGEKLFEELYLHSETVVPTAHPKVFCLKTNGGETPDPAVRFCLNRLGPVDLAIDPVLARLRGDFQEMLDLTPPERLAVP
ncbi:MAG TPA: nucleoside-diphosphate sugar epimerase/dehydratase [Planctomycetota bacterium]|nr:nucleoside-diphosphate sugar epimerase/dehydratase [Planctomycetota bacterium]